MMSGVSLAQTAAPAVAEWLIRDYGWRLAYGALGVGWGGLTLVVTLLCFRELAPTGQHRSASGPADAAAKLGGLALGQAVRDQRMIRIAVAILLQCSMMMAFTIHLFPLLTEQGVSHAQAVILLSLVGIAALAGQFVTGWLADRTTSTILPVACFVAPAFGYAVLLEQVESRTALVSAVLVIGYCSGATINITTYLSTRYVGTAHFGKIFGVISSCMGLAAGLGPLVAGGTYDLTDSYEPFLGLAACCSLLAGMLVFRLGRYPDFTREMPTNKPHGL
jgi:predicted MFS family arabinose efflux permease